jgi:hypothetical protein
VTVAAYVPNLMDRSKVAAAAQALGVAVSFASSVDALDRTATLTLVDLGRAGVIDALATTAGRSIGFASHVDRDLLLRARAAGCDQVLARSAFFSRLPALLAGGGAGDGTP